MPWETRQNQPSIEPPAFGRPTLGKAEGAAVEITVGMPENYKHDDGDLGTSRAAARSYATTTISTSPEASIAAGGHGIVLSTFLTPIRRVPSRAEPDEDREALIHVCSAPSVA